MTATRPPQTKLHTPDRWPHSERPRYRLRTVLREYLPEALAALVPKGAHSCRDHEWYQAEPGVYRCYHCKVGVTTDMPWDEREYEARLLEADAMRIRAGLPVQSHPQ